MEFSEASVPKLLTTFQRDINRATDSDRSTRKRGLQKLLEDIPWGKKSQREDLKVLVSHHLLKILVGLVADEVEKCRELSLQILKKCIEKCDDISFDNLHSLVVSLCARLSDLPFPEPAEEIRLLVVELLQMVRKHATFVTLTGTTSDPTAEAVNNSQANESNISAIDEKIAQMLVKALTDGFPSVKRAGAELLCDITFTSPQVVKSYYKPLLKALQGNCSHQHSKTRSITLQAIGKGLCTLGLEDYQTLLRDPIIGIFLRTVSDRTASVRVELGNVCADIFDRRVTQCLQRERALLAEDFELAVILFLLHGDVIDEVSAEGKRQLIRTVHKWERSIPTEENSEVDVPINNSAAMDVDDGELAMQKINSSSAAHPVAAPSAVIDYDDVSKLRAFVSTNLRSLLSILQEGVEGWTTDSRKRYLRGLNCLILYADNSINTVLPRLLSVLSMQVRDEDGEVRGAAEECCVRLGSQAASEELLEILLPRVSGAVAGGDTAAQRANAIGVLTHVLKGVKIAHTAGRAVNAPYLCNAVASCLAETPLYAYREASLRESVLLLVRKISECFGEECKASLHIQQSLLLALMFLCCRCPNEDEVIPEIAQRELRRLAAICTGDAANTSTLLGAHFHFLFYHIVTFQSAASNAGSDPLHAQLDVSDAKNAPKLAAFYDALKLHWESDSPAMAALGVLVREAPGASWANHALLLPIVTKLVQPKLAPAAGSAEANAISYSSQRGEEVAVSQAGLVDARLNLLALLEGLVRSGTADWECSKHIANASGVIIKYIIVPNLVWRVGRVEATVRKVALALCYGILKAGAVKEETLFSTAAELVPLIISHLDDSEVTPRQMACLCATVLFERLRGVFSEQSIHEIYPKLVARLDDSNDQVRVAICGALVMFFQCGANKYCFSHTTVDYSLDQLFIHLDDPEPAIQQAVLGAIIQVAASLDKEAVLRKAEKNRVCHRTPTMCDKVVFEVTGVEILEE